MDDLLAKIEQDAWRAVDWESCRNIPFAHRFRGLIDNAVFDNDANLALERAFIFKRLCRQIGDKHLVSMSEGSMGSALRVSKAHDLAREHLEIALDLCECPTCQGDALLRLAALEDHKGNYQEAVRYSTRALHLVISTGDSREICQSFAKRATSYRLMDSYEESFNDTISAANLVDKMIPHRVAISILLNTLWLSSVLDHAHLEKALAIVQDMRKRLEGARHHRLTRPYIKWTRGLLQWRLGDVTGSIRSLEYGIQNMERNEMSEQLRLARADIAMVRASSPRPTLQHRHIRNLLEEAIREEDDEDKKEFLGEVLDEPTLDNLLKWRRSIESPQMPVVEPNYDVLQVHGGVGSSSDSVSPPGTPI